jgi:hypothetical protein
MPTWGLIKWAIMKKLAATMVAVLTQ